MSIGVFLLLSGCNTSDKDEIEVKAKEVAIEFMKNQENINFVPDEVEFTTAIGGGTVWVYGHNKDNKAEEFSVTVNYDEDSYTVGGIGTGETVEEEEF